MFVMFSMVHYTPKEDDYPWEFCPVNDIPFAQFRDGLAKYLDEVAEKGTPLHVTREQGSNIVVVSEDEYNGWLETIHLLSNPTNAKELMEAVAELNAGKGQEHALIER
jgi:antitoxin YefM